MSAAPSAPVSPALAGRDSLLAFVAVGAAVTGLVRITLTLPWIGNLGAALVSLLFLFVPLYAGARRGEDLIDYGFLYEPVGRGLAMAAVAIAIIVPLFSAGFLAFYETACHSPLLSHLAPVQMCAQYGGLDHLHAPSFAWAEPVPPHHHLLSAEWCAVQWLVVALPEELFFRGYLLKKLEQRFPPRRRVLGGGVGLALVLSAAAFAIIHLPKDGDPRALATFFPGLLFGWMRSATGSILASTVAHGASNVLARILQIAVSR
ncbi:MAG TPA: CPBP family intramembrane glutamic endopeptidase [Kofleriaceae bacterium]